MLSIFSSIAGFVAQKVAAWGVSRIVRSPIMWAAAGVLGLTIAYQAGHSRAVERCRASATATRLKAVERDLSIQQKVTELVQQEHDTLTAQAADLEGKVSRYETELRTRSDRCAATDADVKRLRNIR